jgi:hypothetical protein
MLGDGIRRNIATISDEERTLFVNALRQLDDPTSAFVYPNNVGHEGADASGNIPYWDMQEQIHKDAHAHGSDVHEGPAFVPWHRVLVNRFEELLRLVDPRLSLHYWDWTTDPRVGSVPLLKANAASPGLMGASSGNAGDPFADFESTEKTDTADGGDGIHDHIWRSLAAGLPPVASDATILAATNYTDFEALIHPAHDSAHGYIGGTIGGGINPAHFSFHDPFVFLLHSNMDRLWATWQRSPGRQTRLNPSTAYGTIAADFGFPPAEAATFFNEWVQPWAGVDNGGTLQTDLNPWKSDVSQQAHIPYNDPSVIIPRSYDTAPHSSYIIVNQDTFSDSQLDTLGLPGSPAIVSKAFYVVYEGFEPKELGVASAPLPSVPPNLPVVTFTGASNISAVNPSAIYEAPGGAIDMPQRITIAYDLRFANTADFPHVVNMRATFAYNVDTGTGGSVVSLNEVANAALVLINQPNPYMIDVDPALAPPNPYWLSTDTRVFQVKGPGGGNPAGSVLGVPQGDADGDPFTFINGVLSALRTTPSQFNDANFPQDENTSVLELSRSVGMPPDTQRVYNYAIARVRYRAPGPPTPIDAVNVQVFFRAFSTMVSALDYDSTSGTTGNYRRTGNSSPSMPLLGIENNQVGTGEIASIPFFAEARHADMAAQTDGTNMKTIPGNGAEQVEFFGCWLDLNQMDARFPRFPLTDPGGPNGPFTGATAGNPLLSIQQLMTGYHECLVAEVFFWPAGTAADPIPLHAGPGSSDRLAQRNMSIVASGNPGWPVTHTVQHTFLLKPSVRFVDQAPVIGGGTAAGIRNFGPDELMVQWNNVPRDSSATFYFPEIEVDEILKLSALRQHPEVLSKVDAHTLTCRLADVTFIPLPSGRNGNLAGLISLTLPPWIKVGQTYRLNVQQYSGVTRKILGAFQLTIPVKNEPEILPSEIRKLSVLRYIQQSIPSGNRWSLIFQRYVQQIADRVDAFGGNSSQVGPSPNGDGKDPNAAKCRFWGRVTGVLLAALVVALGTLIGAALTTTSSVLAVILVAVALLWFRQCHPKPCRWLRIFIGGAGMGAAVLAIFALLGITTLQTVPILSVVVILVVVAVLVGAVQKCF